MKKHDKLSDLQRSTDIKNFDEKSTDAKDAEAKGHEVADIHEDEKDFSKKKLRELKEQLNEKTKQCEDYLGMYQRLAAEFDNYKKRTAKEKDTIYSDASCDVVSAFLPAVDNFERVIGSLSGDADLKSIKEGIELVFRQVKDVMKNLGVSEIKCVNENFNPELHNAVMHIMDEAFGENVVVDEFQKGYLLNEKVIRHSMVKVAN